MTFVLFVVGVALWLYFVNWGLEVQLLQLARPASDDHELDRYELAYLASGKERMVVRTALVELVASGVCEWNGGESPVRASAVLPADAHPAERALYMRLREPITLRELTLRHDPALIPDLRVRLEQRGLLALPNQSNLPMFVATMIPFALAFIALRAEPTSSLSFTGVALCGAAVVLTCCLLSGELRTDAGNQRLEAARTKYVELSRWTEQGTPAQLALAFALFGAEAVAHSPLALLHDVLATDPAQPTRQGGCGCGGCTGCSLDDSGSGCGG